MSIPTRFSALLGVLGVIAVASAPAARASDLRLEPARMRPAESSATTSPLDALPTSARGRALFEGDVPQVVSTLVVSPTSSQVGVFFELAPGWHLYWRNPGETGIAPSLDLRVDGHRVGGIEWPVPETFREADDLFLTYGYAGRVLLAAKLDPDASRAPARDANDARGAMARADVRALVCRTECVPIELSLALPLPASAREGERTNARPAATEIAIASLFAEHAAQLAPRADALGWHVEAAWRGGVPQIDETGPLALSIDPCARGTANADGSVAGACAASATAAESVAFLPYESESLEFEREQRISSGNASAPLALELSATRLEADVRRLRGLVALRLRDGALRHAEIDVPLRAPARAAGSTTASAAASTAVSESAAQAPSPSRPESATSGGLDWLRVLLLALVGGFILNGMPCVLPVLAIKVFSIADLALRDAREVRLHGLAYTAGILGSMLVLAALVVAMRAAGHAVGWGFQFQEPLFVAGIAALLVAFALNLFGVFEIELGQGRLADVGQHATGLSRSLFEGLLAVVLATPCTAPFLGTAVGFAFASSAVFVVAIFLAIGLGLASPFLVVSFRPTLARYIPRSGPWMLKLRAGLGFCLLGTVLWLLWIVGQSGGTDAVVSLLAALLFLAFLLWVWGQLQPMRSPWLGRASAAGIAALAFGSFNLIDFERVATTEGRANGAAGRAAEATNAPESDFLAYDEAAVRETLARGVPVFVLFTADWCITCKVNERTVLDRPSVRDALTSAGYALFKADWTRRDEKIRTKLAEFGRAGVPLYLVYDPAEPDRPKVLSELLSERAVLAALRPATPPSAI